tara:strand:+ start:745 stop:1323 length:579 start_codon:yes stop_codon:yes gene_type:complete
MDYNIDEIRKKFFKAIDGNNDYSIKDFDSEFKNANHTAQTIATPKIGVKLINKSNNADPEYQTEGSSGFDFRAYLETPVWLQPGEVKIIPTGLFFGLPQNTEIQVRPRSGLAAKHGITVLNSPGTIDSDYIGEVKIILINHGKLKFQINSGERIAQGIIGSAIGKTFIEFEKVNTLDNTDRNSGGFGSTGLK